MVWLLPSDRVTEPSAGAPTYAISESTGGLGTVLWFEMKFAFGVPVITVSGSCTNHPERVVGDVPKPVDMVVWYWNDTVSEVSSAPDTSMSRYSIWSICAP